MNDYVKMEVLARLNELRLPPVKEMVPILDRFLNDSQVLVVLHRKGVSTYQAFDPKARLVLSGSRFKHIPKK